MKMLGEVATYKGNGIIAFSFKEDPSQVCEPESIYVPKARVNILVNGQLNVQCGMWIIMLSRTGY